MLNFALTASILSRYSLYSCGTSPVFVRHLASIFFASTFDIRSRYVLLTASLPFKYAFLLLRRYTIYCSISFEIIRHSTISPGFASFGETSYLITPSSAKGPAVISGEYSFAISITFFGHLYEIGSFIFFVLGRFS